MIVVSPKNVDIHPQSQELKEQIEWHKLEYGNVNAGAGKSDVLHVSETCMASLLDRRSRSRNYVKHQYEDQYDDPIFQGEAHETSCSSFNSPQNRTNRGAVNLFPIKLHELLSKVEKEEIADIISWQPHGRCFVIRQSQKFVKEVLSRYFNHIKMRSFQRQLNLYGFRRLTKGADNGGYYHELFLRGRPDLCSRIIRVKINSNDTKLFPSSDTEPQFHTMEPCVKSIFSAPITTSTHTSPFLEVHPEITFRAEAISMEKVKEIANNLTPSNGTQIYDKEFTSTHSLLQYPASSWVSREISHIPPALPSAPRLPLHASSKLSKIDHDGNNRELGDTFDKKFTPTLSLQSKSSSVRSQKLFLMSSALPYPRSLPTPSFALSQTDSEGKGKQSLASSSYLQTTSITNDPSNELCIPNASRPMISSTSKPLRHELPNLEKKLFFEGCPFYYLDPSQIKES